MKNKHKHHKADEASEEKNRHSDADLEHKKAVDEEPEEDYSDDGDDDGDDSGSEDSSWDEE